MEISSLHLKSMVLATTFLLASCVSGPASLPSASHGNDQGTSSVMPEVIVSAGNADKAKGALRQAMAELQKQNLLQADMLLQGVLGTADFAALSGRERHQALYIAGIVAMQLKDFKRAATLLVQSSSMADAQGDDWRARLTASYFAKDLPDAVTALTELAKRWPDSLSEQNDQFIYMLWRESRNFETDEAQFQLLRALYGANWKPVDNLNVSSLWHNLALLLLDRHQVDDAADVASKVTGPEQIISIQSDRRFNAIVDASPTKFSFDVAAANELHRLQVAASDAPLSVKPQLMLIDVLCSLGRLKEALHLADTVLSAAQGTDTGKPSLEDRDSDLVWIRNARANALYELGRWDEAVAEMTKAAAMTERGRKNISQAINLAGLYRDLGKPKQALKAVASLSLDDGSPYGKLQYMAIQHAAAVQLRDAAAAERALNYLREHKLDAIRTLQRELLIANQEDEAAALLIFRLEDKALRTDALTSVQNYLAENEPPVAAEYTRRHTALLARPDVKAAIEKVGRISSYHWLRR